jgi:ABC-type lipoprotein release transport system permease subunit
VALDLDLVLTALFITPLFAALASLVPMALAVTQDPVRVLGEAS